MDTADNHAQLAYYEEIARFMWDDITGVDRTTFINALYAAMPAYRWLPNVTVFPRQNIIYARDQEAVYKAIHAKSSSNSHIYAAVIICGFDKKCIAREIKLLFGRFMSMAYSARKLPITS
ncbi:hypothetical protein OsI_35933 [Oryza sativa Indica Group]|uniref:Uncharacterized protein n=1 Tax=Oryza sativa subsp. indica TaxID=39946 RepID=B8BK87_ORYSI|nr:hypothetical protein OsI_35933 [Oryza sativa Indica Group]